jgi:4-amino-4-deoxy-L-arabinose transferase-like glycosyltransferase
MKLEQYKLIKETNEPSNQLLIIALVLFVFNLIFAGFGISLWDDDESAYAGFALRMIETGDWVNPQYIWSDVHRKTPFHFWTIALSYLVFGINEFAVRLPAAIAVFMTAVLIYFQSAKLFGKAVSAWAAIIFSSVLLPMSMGKISFTDAWLMFFETLALLSLFRYIHSPALKWNFLFWLAVSFGIMVKGPPIIILVGGVWLGLAIFDPNRKRLIGTHPWLFGPLSLLPFFLWAYLSYKADDGKLLTFLYEWYVLKRIGGAVFGQSGPPGYHFIVALISFLPWLPFFIGGLFSVFRRPLKTGTNLYLFLWLLFGWIFYEFMTSKLPSYALGAQPAMAIAAAILLIKSLENASLYKMFFKWSWFVTGIIWFLFSVSIWPIFYEVFPDQSSLVIIISVVLTPIAAALFILRGQNRVLLSFIFGSLSLLLIWSLGISAFDRSPAKAARTLSIHVSNEVANFQKPKETRVVLCGFNIKQMSISIPFYLEKELGELKQYSPAEFIAAASNGEKFIAVIGVDALPEIDNAVHNSIINTSYYGAAPEWRSLNDQLKVHQFKIWHNFK